jgi:hypothetical protein
MSLVVRGAVPVKARFPVPFQVKSTASEVALAGSFSVGLFPNRACKFPAPCSGPDHAHVPPPTPRKDRQAITDWEIEIHDVDRRRDEHEHEHEHEGPGLR